MLKEKKPNYYKVFRLIRNTTLEEIKHIYRKLILIYHLDKNINKSEKNIKNQSKNLEN